MRRGHIGAVEVLCAGADDALIEQSRALFEKRRKESHGFEVWDRARLVYRYPPLAPKYTLERNGTTRPMPLTESA
jgi:hypothetical protein